MEASLLPAPSGTPLALSNQSIPQDLSFIRPSSSSALDNDYLQEGATTKRPASPGSLYDGLHSRKRMKLTFESSLSISRHSPSPGPDLDSTHPVDRNDSATKAMALSHRLLEELTCGCCTELCYNVSTAIVIFQTFPLNL